MQKRNRTLLIYKGVKIELVFRNGNKVAKIKGLNQVVNYSFYDKDKFKLFTHSIDTVIDTLNPISSDNESLRNNLSFSLGDNLIYNIKSKSIYKNDAEIKLTKNEIIFLELILANQKQLLRYELISKELFNSTNVDTNIPSIKNMLLRLRKKLGIPLVDSVFGLGYRVL